MNSARRYVEWRINFYEHGYTVVREENGSVHIIGGSSVSAEAEAILQGDRKRVLHDPMAVEVRGPQYHFKGWNADI